jgi:hypothetical protein
MKHKIRNEKGTKAMSLVEIGRKKERVGKRGMVGERRERRKERREGRMEGGKFMRKTYNFIQINLKTSIK